MNTTFLIKSTDNSSFGTAFCVAHDENGSFLVTCTHVVEACGSEHLLIDGKAAQVEAMGCSQDIDLAVLYVEGLVATACLPLSAEIVPLHTPFCVEGFKVHKDGTHLQRPLNGSIENISQIHHGEVRCTTYELMIDNAYSIERGYSGSAVVSNGQLIGVATDRNNNGKQAYAIPIHYLAEIWEAMPEGLLVEPVEQKSSFSREVFATLDSNPMILFSTDSYNHADYIDHIREEAIQTFGKAYVMDINAARFKKIDESDAFFHKLGKKLKLGSEIEDAFDFEEAFEKYIEKTKGFKTFILVTGLEKLDESVRHEFAETLRTLYQEFRKHFNLVIFGGEKLIKLKYDTGKHSYFNFFSQKMIPNPTLSEWQKGFADLNPQSYQNVMQVTGGYQRLSEHCFEQKAYTVEDAKRVIVESFFKVELFLPYEGDDLCLRLAQESLGDAHPYSSDPILYRLYWDNLIVEKRGKFVWRSPFLQALGREVLGC